MIEAGLVALVQGTAAVNAIAAVGGHLSEVPKDGVLPTWTYVFISAPDSYTLAGEHGLIEARIQIDCYGNNGAECIRLARAIDRVLSGYSGILTDVDSTAVDSCFRSNLIDFFDTAARTYRRLLEYKLWFIQDD